MNTGHSLSGMEAKCQHCGGKFKVNAPAKGNRFTCPACAKRMTSPRASITTTQPASSMNQQIQREQERHRRLLFAGGLAGAALMALVVVAIVVLAMSRGCGSSGSGGGMGGGTGTGVGPGRGIGTGPGEGSGTGGGRGSGTGSGQGAGTTTGSGSGVGTTPGTNSAPAAAITPATPPVTPPSTAPATPPQPTPPATLPGATGKPLVETNRPSQQPPAPTATTNTVATTTQPSAQNPDPAAPESSTQILAMPSALSGGGGGGGGVGGKLPVVMQGRCDPAQRMRRLLAEGGSKECEDAVVASLEWLKAHQNNDGSWGKQFPGAMTGFAILCYLGHCELPKTSAAYGPTVYRGIQYLHNIFTQQPNQPANIPGVRQLRLPLSVNLRQLFSTYTYENAIATYALAEAYTMTGDAELAPAVVRAADSIIAGQGKAGGWIGYGSYDPNGIDMSVTGWQVQALKAVYLTKLRVQGLDGSLDRAINAIEKMQGTNGVWNYQRHGDIEVTKQPGTHVSLTGVGTLCMMLWKRGNSINVARGIEVILKEYAAVQPPSPPMLPDPSRVAQRPLIGQGRLNIPKPVVRRNRNVDFYAWYYNTLACFQRGGKVWTQWNDTFKPEILGSRNPDGTWSADHGFGGAGLDADIYNVSLCTLMLEAYYRYLPTGS